MRRSEYRGTQPADTSPGDVLQHLGDSLHAQWRRYRKRHQRCQEQFSRKAVHNSRVETRRLIAQIELLAGFIPKSDLEKARRALKRHLDTFDQLRDTQVQLALVKPMTDGFPAAAMFRDWLRRRERDFTRTTRKAVKRIKTKQLARRLVVIEKQIRRERKRVSPDRAFQPLRGAIDRAFVRVGQLRRRIKARDTATIHRTRVAFKRFRYMVEAMSPLLPGVTAKRCLAMRKYQTVMGDIQDAEVLLAAWDKFERQKKIDAQSAQGFHAELLRRKRRLVQVYLNTAVELRRFWPLPNLAGDVARQKSKQ